MYTECEGVYLSDEECLEDFEYLQYLYNVDFEEQIQKNEIEMLIQEDEMEKYLDEMIANDEEFCCCI